MMIELYRRSVDPKYNPDKRYVFRSTYPDFTVENEFKFVGGVPVETKGVELTVACTFAPYING